MKHSVRWPNYSLSGNHHEVIISQKNLYFERSRKLFLNFSWQHREQSSQQPKISPRHSPCKIIESICKTSHFTKLILVQSKNVLKIVYKPSCDLNSSFSACDVRGCSVTAPSWILMIFSLRFIVNYKYLNKKFLLGIALLNLSKYDFNSLLKSLSIDSKLNLE